MLSQGRQHNNQIHCLMRVIVDRLLMNPIVNQVLISVFLHFRAQQVASSVAVEKKCITRKWYTQWIVFREQEDQPIKLSVVHYNMWDKVRSVPSDWSHDYKEVYPEAALKVELDTYVDNFLSCAQDDQKARDLEPWRFWTLLISTCKNKPRMARSYHRKIRRTNRSRWMSIWQMWQKQSMHSTSSGCPKKSCSFKVNLNVNSVNTKR